MRVALISDIHGNDVAFAAVVADLEQVGVESVVCLGDAVQGGAQPAEVLDRLRALGYPTVLGNADDFVLEVPSDSPEPITEIQLAVREWTLRRLAPAHLEQMRAFRPTIELSLDGHRALCFHGSPRSYDDVLLHELEISAVEPFEGFDDFDLLAGGHTHTQWARRIGGTLYVNPGAVGLVADRYEDEEMELFPLAQYALVVVDHTGLGVEFRTVRYSVDDLRAAVAASGRPNRDRFLSEWRD